MRRPWQRRRDKHEVRQAQERLEKIRGQWPRVHAAVAPLRRERQLNGWTDTIVSIFDAPRKDHPR